MKRERHKDAGNWELLSKSHESRRVEGTSEGGQDRMSCRSDDDDDAAAAAAADDDDRGHQQL
jgi:hypothetical protein